MFLIIGGLWQQRRGRKERQEVGERRCQPYLSINDEDDLDSKRDLLTGNEHHVHEDQTGAQVRYTKAKYGAASMQLGNTPAVQKDLPTSMTDTSPEGCSIIFVNPVSINVTL